MAWRTVVGLARISAALAGIVALVARFIYGLGFHTFVSADYFGYLTMQSNIALVAVHAVGGGLALRGRDETRRFSTLRCAVTCFVLVAGVVFGILASQAPTLGYRLEVPWSDQVLHFFLPTFTLVDWLVSPGRQPVRWRTLALIVGYPVVWGIGTVLRGRMVGWYPYFFLDPAQAGYPVSFLLYSGGALGLFALVGAGLIAATRTSPLGVRELRRPGLDHGPTRAQRALLVLLSRPSRRARGSGRARR
jgi:hypothetical protein